MIGPFKIKKGIFVDGVPALQIDPNSWTKVGVIKFAFRINSVIYEVDCLC